MPKQINRVKWSAMDIPFGVEFDEKTGTFSGAPEDEGEYIVPVSVQTNYGKDTKDVVLNISQNIVTEIKGNIFVLECIDDGNKIIFFGNTPDENIGVFFTYNPQTKVTSNIFRIIDGNPLGITNTGIENSPFKEVAIDPITKKWVAFFGTHYIRTPEGVKDLGSDITLGSITLCWANNLQKFCVIASNQNTSTTNLTSYVFDIDGNLLNSSTQIRDIYGFYIKPNSHGGTLAWSDTAGKFVAVSTEEITNDSNDYRPAIYSSDGLTWDFTQIKATTGTAYTDTGGTKTVTFPNITTKLIVLTDGRFLLISRSFFTQYTDSGNGVYLGYHYSSDGVTWSKNSNISQSCVYDALSSETMDTVFFLTYYSDSSYNMYNTSRGTIVSSWQQTKNTGNAYLSIKNFGIADYVKYPLSSNPKGFSLEPKEIRMIWSDTANSLVIPELLNGFQVFSVKK